MGHKTKDIYFSLLPDKFTGGAKTFLIPAYINISQNLTIPEGIAMRTERQKEQIESPNLKTYWK